MSAWKLTMTFDLSMEAGKHEENFSTGVSRDKAECHTMVLLSDYEVNFFQRAGQSEYFMSCCG